MKDEKIASYEAKRSELFPWLDGNGYKGKGGDTCCEGGPTKLTPQAEAPR